MELVLPSLDYAESFQEAIGEATNPAEDINLWQGLPRPTSIEHYIQMRFDHANGRNLPDGWIPASTYWLIDNDQFIGQTNIRHELTEHLRTVGGHIGYWIRPSLRKRGHGTEILRLSIQKCHELGIKNVLVTCDETNIGSRKVIEANGGVFECAREMGEGLPKKLAFWIS